MKIKVKYNSETGLVTGYYPDNIDYPNNDINTTDKTIDGLPYIEIEKESQNVSGVLMAIIDGVYQEYVESDDALLSNAKTAKIAEIQSSRKDYQYSNITFEGNEYTCTETAQNKFFHLFNFSTGDINWRLADDETWVTLTREQATNLANSIIARETEAYSKESELTTNINTALTLEEIESIIW